jgi:hypothetical protein
MRLDCAEEWPNLNRARPHVLRQCAAEPEMQLAAYRQNFPATL